MDQGYDPFNINDKFYREICTPYKSENGTDVLLDDREEFIYNSIANETICPDNCEYSSYYATKHDYLLIIKTHYKAVIH